MLKDEIEKKIKRKEKKIYHFSIEQLYLMRGKINSPPQLVFVIFCFHSYLSLFKSWLFTTLVFFFFQRRMEGNSFKRNSIVENLFRK